MKKLLALVLALAMMLALAVPAFAASGFWLSKVKVNDAEVTITSSDSIGEVEKGATITFTFNSNVDESTVSGNLSVYKNNTKKTAISVTPTVSEKKISFTLPTDIEEYADGYTIKLGAGLKDENGMSIQETEIIKFTVKASGSSTKTIAVTPSADAIADKVDPAEDLVINVTFSASGSMKHFTVAKSALATSDVVLYKDGVKVSNPSITLADVSASSEQSVISFTIEDLDEGAEYELVIPKGDYTSTNDKGATNTYTIADDFTIAFETLTTETTTAEEPTTTAEETTAATTTEEVANTADNSASMSLVVMISASVVAMGAISTARKKED